MSRASALQLDSALHDLPFHPVSRVEPVTMPLTSDLTVDPSKFDRKLADEQTKQFNQKLINIWKEGPRWYEVRHVQSFIVVK
jgi:hypothetical protein